MFWLRLLFLGLVCLAAGCCSTSGSGYAHVGYAAPPCGCGP